MFKTTLASIASLAVLAMPLAVQAQDDDVEEATETPRTFPPVNFNIGDDPENVWLLDLSNGERVAIRLMPEWAPSHVERIKTLTRQGFYDGVVFHRVIEGFMAQGGDPTGTGMGGSERPDLKAEFNDVSHQRGVCSMARSQNPDSANSQFFICFDDASYLDGQYTVWGKVSDGMDAVDKIAKGEPPAEPDKIVSMKVAADL